MTRFVWLQYKIPAVVTAAALLALAVMLGVTGEHLLAVYRSTVGVCQQSHDCSLATSTFQSTDNHLAQLLNDAVVVVPALIGLFWGAPLVSRELETGAFRLAWTQSVTRTRWLAVKLAAAGFATMAVAGLVSLMVTWWSDPIAKVNPTLWANFDQRDVVPIGYAALGFMLGVTAGLIFRRTLPAMATSLVVFVTARLCADRWLRPLLLSPVKLDAPVSQSTVNGFGQMNGASPILFAGGPNLPDAWLYSVDIVNRSGQPLDATTLRNVCPALFQGFHGAVSGLGFGPSPGGPVSAAATGLGGGASVRAAPTPGPPNFSNPLPGCIARLASGYHEIVTYQPASRYWPLQWIELGVYLAAALALVGLGVWWVRHRLS